MKRAAIACVVCVMMSTAASAAGITFGVKAGLYSANTTEVPAGWGDTSFKSGFVGGAYLNYGFDDNFSFQPEVLYTQKGLNGSITRGPFASSFTANYNYVEIPLLARYKMATRSSFIPYLVVGPCLGINVSADLDMESRNPMTHKLATGSIDYSKVMNTTEFTWIFGVGFGLGLGPGEVTFDARFDLGLSKVYKGGTVIGEFNGEDYQDTVYPGTSKNIGFALLLGYTL
jgi:hypothetical protein